MKIEPRKFSILSTLGEIKKGDVKTLKRKTKIPQSTLYRYLNVLLKDNFIEYKVKGKRIFSLTKEGKQLLKSLEEDS